MPSKESVEQFKEVFKQVANEPEVLASRGLSPQEVSPPEPGESILPWSQEEVTESSDPLDDPFLSSEPSFGAFSQGGVQQESELSEGENSSDFLGESDSKRESFFVDEKTGEQQQVEGVSPAEVTQEKVSALKQQEATSPSTFQEDAQAQKNQDDGAFSSLNLDDLLTSDEGLPLEESNEVNSDYFNFAPSEGETEEENSKPEEDLLALDTHEQSELNTSASSFEPMDDLFSFEEEGKKSEESSSYEEAFSLPIEAYQRFYEKLLTLPKNLRLAVAEVVLKPELDGKQIFEFLNLVTNERNYRKIARAAGSHLGKVIILPHSYYRAQDLLNREKSFWYNVQCVTWPILKKALLFNAAVFLFFYLSFRYVLEPWQANNYFEKGLEAIKLAQNEEANELFRKAYCIRNWDEWFIRYASAYEEQRNYEEAVEKYEEMLTVEPFAFGSSNRRRTKFNHDGYLAYSQLRTRQGFYQEADNLLQAVISENVRDYEGWLARGDNNMAWASIDATRYVEALRSYASVLEMHGDSPEVLFKLLNYYVKVDDETEAYRLYQYIEKKNYNKVDPLVYTDYAAYLLSKDAQLVEYMDRKEKIFRIGKYSQGQQALLEGEYSHVLNKNMFYLSDIGHILSRSNQSDPTYPLTYYYLSRYFRRSQNINLSRQAIEEALKYFYLKKSLSPHESSINILSFKELGEILEESQEYLLARQYYQRGIELYEDLLNLEVLKPSRDLSELFALQGYSYYRFYEDIQAKLFFEKAIKQGFCDVDLYYSLVNIYYLQRDYKRAINYLFEIESTPSYRVDTNLLYAMATILCANEDQRSAIGYYLQLLSILEERKAVLAQVDLNNPVHRHLIEDRVKTLNNLGVAELSLAKDLAHSEYFNEGIKHLSQAEELFDISTRGDRKEKILEKDLAALNLGSAWKQDGQLLLYNSIPRYLEEKANF